MNAIALSPSPAASPPATRRPLLLVLLVLVAIGGVALTLWRLHLTDRRVRADLLQQATLIAWALRADHVAALSGSEADRASAGYDRLHDQLVRTRAGCPDWRALWVLRRDADRLVCLVNAERAEAPGFLSPGQPWDGGTATATVQVLETGRSSTDGPDPEGVGDCIRVIVPLFHPVTDQVVAVLCLDADVGPWRRHLVRQAILPAGSSLLILLLIGVGYVRSRRPHQLADPGAVRAFWSGETTLTAALALVVTATAALFAHDGDRWARHESFRRLATLQASLLQQAMFRIGDNYLEGIGRLFMSSNFVDQREFSEYVDYLLSRPYAQAWGWIPSVAAADRADFERALRQWAVPDYSIWEYDVTGNRVPAAARARHFPICYAEPPDGNEGTLGYDLAAHPAGAQAIDLALRTRLTTATAPLSFTRAAPPGVIVVLRPVFAADDATRLSGFAFVVLRLESLLRRALSRENTRNEETTDVVLFEIQQDGKVRLLTASGQNPTSRDDPMRSLQQVHRAYDSLLAPIFAFGHVYLVAARPGGDFDQMHPLRSGRRTAVTGLALSALVVALVGTLTSRRSALERLVAARTADLRASGDSYHGLFNSIRQAIYIMDAEGRFLDVNEGAVAMYGYAREDIVGKTPEFVSAPGANDLAAVEQAHRAAWNGTPQYFEFRGLRKNGESFPKDVWLCKGSYFGKDVVIAIASDTSERKRAEREQNRLQEQLQQSQKMESIGRLAGGVAHDFNNMLQAILGNAALALQEKPSAPVGEYLTEIRRSAERSADLTRQLLAFASRQTVTPRVLDLNDTISGMLKMLGRLIGEDIRLQWVPGRGLWPIKMDPSQLDQILANLAVNARDAIGGVGTLTIETANLSRRPENDDSCYHGAPRGDYATLTVRDTGAGMDAYTLAHLFEPFFTTKKLGLGTGLGLATVFGVVKQNGGFISVKSAPGHGATFVIGIPRAPLDSEPVVTPAGVAAGRNPPPRGGCETVLLVEDEKAILRVGEEYLRRLGYHILAAQTPRQAVALAREHAAPIQLLITDVVLPEMNGRELALLMSSLHPEVRCLFMSGYTADVIAERGVLDEHVHFLQKPFTLGALAAAVRSVLDGEAHA